MDGASKFVKGDAIMSLVTTFINLIGGIIVGFMTNVGTFTEIMQVYSTATVAAVGVAAHEAGHAVQYAVGYAPVRLRSAIVPVTNLGSRCSMILLLIGLLFYSQSLFLVGILLFSLTTFFQLVTLPVEFNASRRALETIEGRNLLDHEELTGARKVLRAAALTYVAALLMSALQLLRYVLIFLGRNGGRDGRRGGGRG